MSSQKNIQDELISLGSNLPVNNNLPFSVPEGYFEELADALLAKVKSTNNDAAQTELSELSPLLAGLSKQMPYTVPVSYFENNAKDLDTLTQETDSAILAAIGNHTPYVVPEGYFETLPQTILARVSTPKAKVIPLFGRTWMRVASAAAIAGALFFGSYQLLNNGSTANSPVTASRPAATEQKLVASNAHPIEEIKTVSTKDLEEFIANVRVLKPVKTTEKQNKTEKADIKDLLKDVPTSEMESFLSTLPTADDEFLILD